MKKTNPLFLFLGSIALITLAIAMTAVINRFQSNKSEDVRAKAANTGIEFTGRVASTDPFVVDDLQFAGATNTGKSLGSFQLTLPAGFNPLLFVVGDLVMILADAETFRVNTDGSPNTLSAIEVKKL